MFTGSKTVLKYPLVKVIKVLPSEDTTTSDRPQTEDMGIDPSKHKQKNRPHDSSSEISNVYPSPPNGCNSSGTDDYNDVHCTQYTWTV